MNKIAFTHKILLPVFCAGFLAACVSQTPEELSRNAREMLKSEAPKSQEAQQAQTNTSAIPAEVQADLRSYDRRQSQAVVREPRFSVQASKMPAVAFFAQLTEETPYSLVVHPDVKGEISLNLRDVTLKEALRVVEDIYGYDIHQEDGVYRVYPAGLKIETIALDYLSLRRFGMSQTQITAGGVVDNERNGMNGQNNRNSGRNSNASGGFGGGGFGGGFGGNMGNMGGMGGDNALGMMGMMMGQAGSTINTSSETDFWKSLEEVLEGIIGEGQGRKVVVSPQAGLATIRAYPGEIRAVRDFLNKAQNSLQRQVVLEARIVEVTLSDGYQQGVNWEQISQRTGNGATFTGTQLDGGSLGGILGIRFSDQNFTGLFEMLSTQGSVQVLSSPRVTATNNQKAVIKIGEDEYFVTDVSTTTVTGTATTSTPNIELTPFFSGIALDVTPQIGDSGQITLHVHPSVTETIEQEKTIVLNQERMVLPLARSNIRESDTIIRARDGEVVVIGGLMQTSYTEEISQVPLLGSIPLVGELFKNRSQREQKKELIIMLRPTIVEADTWSNEINRSSELLRRWYEAE